MMYLIGGPPRVGKSQLAERLVTEKPMASFSLDYLYDLSQVRDLDGFSGAPILEKGRLFYPTLKELLVNVHLRSRDCVIEGEVILPEFIAELSEVYEIKSCFLGLSSTSMEAILGHSGHFNWPQWKLDNGYEEEVKDLAQRTASRSLIIESEAKKHGQAYFDLSADYQAARKKAIYYLLEQ